MPMLLEDLAEETTTGNRRLADRLDAEARELTELGQVRTALEGLQQRARESARQATAYVIARLPQAEGVWQLTLIALRKEPNTESQERLLRGLLSALESGRQLARRPRDLWALAEQLGVPPEGLEDLESAEAWFGRRAAEVREALEHRGRGWQPSDPDRFAAGLQLARAGRTVNADAARARFRHSQG